MRTASKNHPLKILVTTFLTSLPILSAYAADSGSFIDFTAMMVALRSNLPAVLRMIVAISYVMGAWFVYSGFYTLKLYGDARTMMSNNASFGPPLFRVLLGASLLFMPRMIKIFIYSIWGAGYQPLDYPTDWASSDGQEVIKAAIAVVRIMGYIAFVRGFSMLGKATRQGAQPGMYGKGIMHVVGGILCINIVGTITIIRNSFGYS